MSAHERNAPHYAAALVEDWARDWVLGPRYLECRHCKGRQIFASAAMDAPFAWHSDKCASLTRSVLHPLHELRDALGTLSPVPT